MWYEHAGGGLWVQMVATVCMFLAGKVEETPRPLREVIMYSYEIRFKKDPAAVQRIRQKVVALLAGLVWSGERWDFIVKRWAEHRWRFAEAMRS